MKRRLKVVLTVLRVGVVIVVVTALWVLWSWLTDLSPALLVVWAALATLALPVVALAGWLFGRYEAAALLRGIDAGIDRVAGAATKLKVRETKGTTNIAVLPQVVHRQLPGEEVIDL